MKLKILNYLDNVKLLAMHNFLLDLRFYTPVAILYFAQVTGSFALGMSIFSMAMVSSAVFEIPTGIFSDRIGRRNTIILGSIATLLSVIFYAIGGTYFVLIVGAILEGLARSFYSGNNDALLYDSLAELGSNSDFADKKGKTDFTSQLAIAMVAVLGGLFAYYLDYSFVYLISIVPAVLGVVVSLLVVEPKVQKIVSSNIYGHIFKALLNFVVNKKLRLLTLSSVIGYAQGEAGYLFRSAFYKSVWPVWAIGLAQGVGSLGASMSFYWSGKIIKKFGKLKTIMYSKIYVIITNIIAASYPTVFSPILMASNSITYGASSTASETLKHAEYTNEERAIMSSLGSLLGSLVFGLIAYLLGLVADLLSPAVGFLLLQPLSMLSLYVIYNLYRYENKK